MRSQREPVRTPRTFFTPDMLQRMDHEQPERSSRSAHHETVAYLLAQAARGDEGAWREILELYSRRVYAMAHSHLRDPELAEEITQSVFVTLAQKLPAREPGGYDEKGKFEPWLFRITMNRVRDEARRRKRQAVPTSNHDFQDSFEHQETPDHPTQNPEIIRLRRAIQELPDQDREIVDLRHIGGMSFKQIADLLQQPLGTVLARHHRALKKLRNILESLPFSP